jgi:hypothetical protein
MKKILALTLLSLLVLAPSAFAAANFGADAEINTTFDSLSDGSTVSTMTMDGRVKFEATGKIENADTGWFAAGCGQVLAKVDGTAAVDDAWGQFGTKSFSLKIGRFEAEELFTKGEDVYIASAGGPGRYETNYARGRNNGGFSLNFTPSETMKVEVAGIYGNDSASYVASDGTTASAAQNKIGVRPAVIISLSNLTIKAGADFLTQQFANEDIDGKTTKFGFGGQVKVQLGESVLGLNVSNGKVKDEDYYGMTGSEDQTTTSFWGFYTMPVGANKLGLGAGYTTEDANDTTEIAGFACYEWKLPVEGAWLKFAASYAAADMKDVGDDQTDIGGRVRLNYTF